MRRLIAALLPVFCLAALPASAQTSAEDLPSLFVPGAARNVWSVDFRTSSESSATSTQTAAPPPAAVEYSDGYRVRARVHKYASVATLPLFATEVALGQSLYNAPSDGKRSAHAAVGAGIGVLFGVNTVTGAWNLWEARRDPGGRGRRVAHALLMMAADAGFLATAALAPEREESGQFEGSKSTHRAVALTSIGLATTGYLIMLFGGR